MKKRNILLMSSCLFLSSCLGTNVPVLNSARDVERLNKNTVWIRARGLSDDDLSGLDRLVNPVFLDFGGGMADCPLYISDTGLCLISQLKSLNVCVLDVGYNNHITDAGLKCISTLNIQEMNLDACQSLSDSGMKYLAEMPYLHRLKINGCPDITDQGLKYLSQSKSLQSLTLGRANMGPDYSQEVEQINNMDLDKENNITLKGLEVLLECQNLKRLTIISENEELVSEASKNHIMEKFKGYDLAIEDYSQLWSERGGGIRFVHN